MPNFFSSILLTTLDDQNGAVLAAQKYNIPYIKIIMSPNLIFSAESPPAPQCWHLPKNIPKFIVKRLVKYWHKRNFINSYKHENLKSDSTNLYDVMMTLKNKEMTPALIFHSDSHQLLEYVLIVAFMALLAYVTASKFDLKTLKNYVFMRPADTSNPSQINIEAMTK